MLHFYGIERKAGDSFRFSFKIDLMSAISQSLATLQAANDDPQAALLLIKQDIEALVRDKNLLDIDHKLISAIKIKSKHLYLVRDILLFLSANQTNYAIIKNYLLILIQELTIEEKWSKACNYLIMHQAALCPLGVSQEVLQENSLINLLLQIIRLTMLAQIPNSPPANLKLAFVYKKFPQHNWISTDFSDYKRVLNWEPAGKNFSLLYLQTVFWQKASGNGTPDQNLTTNMQINKDNIKSNIAGHMQKNILTAQSLPSQAANLTELLAPDAEDFLPPDDVDAFQQNVELVLVDQKLRPRILPARPWESLFEFQQGLRKKYTNAGVVIFYAILRQLLPSKSRGLVVFNVESHLQLFSAQNKLSRKNQDSVWRKTLDILQELEKIDVVRKDKHYLKNNKLLQVFGHISASNSNIPKRLELVLNDIFIGNPSIGILPLAAIYLAIPRHFFSIKIPAVLKEVLNFMVFFTSSWMYGFKQDKGVLTRSLRQIIAGSCMEVSKSDKYRAVYRSLSAFRYMKANKLIADYNLHAGSSKDQWDKLCVISANQESLNLINSLHNSLHHR